MPPQGGAGSGAPPPSMSPQGGQSMGQMQPAGSGGSIMALLQMLLAGGGQGQQQPGMQTMGGMQPMGSGGSIGAMQPAPQVQRPGGAAPASGYDGTTVGYVGMTTGPPVTVGTPPTGGGSIGGRPPTFGGRWGPQPRQTGPPITIHPPFGGFRHPITPPGPPYGGYTGTPQGPFPIAPNPTSPPSTVFNPTGYDGTTVGYGGSRMGASFPQHQPPNVMSLMRALGQVPRPHMMPPQGPPMGMGRPRGRF
jgi:hypothetical protein